MATATAKRRGWIAALIVVLIAAVSAGTWVLARVTATHATNTAVGVAPPASPIAATVAAGPLVVQSTLAGTIQLGTTVTVSVQPPTDGTPVVTALGLSTGDTFTSGSCPIAVAGTPVLMLHLPFPLYRPLQAGATGPDVTALVDELARLGKLPAGTPHQLSKDLIHTITGLCPQATSADAIQPGMIAALPAATVTVTAIKVHLGDTWTDGALSVRSGDPYVAVDTADQAVLAHLDGAKFGDGPLHGTKASLIDVGAAGDDANGAGVGAVGEATQRARFSVPDVTGLADGAQQAVIVTTATTDDDVLVAPIAAVWSAPGSGSAIKKLRADGSTTDVHVTVVASDSGRVAITPTKALAVGDPILVGYQQ